MDMHAVALIKSESCGNRLISQLIFAYQFSNSYLSDTYTFYLNLV